MTTPITSGQDRSPGEAHLNPVLHQSPRQAREAMHGSRPRPHYAPQPVGASRHDILAAKAQLVGHRKGISATQAQIIRMEAKLSAMCPQRVVATIVPGYIDPPERVARAQADKAAGVHAVIGQFCTPEHIRAYHEGRLVPPQFVGFFHAIRDLKHQIVQARTIVEHTEAHNDFLESDLFQLDPQHVVAAHVAGYADPAETVTRAAAAKAAGEVPAANEGM